MIHENSALRAVNLLQVAADRGVNLSPKPNTAMASMVNAVMNDLDLSHPITGAQLVDMIAKVTRGGFVDMDNRPKQTYVDSEHSMATDELVDTLIKGARAQLDMARNVVVPLITQFTDKVIAMMDNAQAAGLEDLFRVTYYKLDDIFTSVIVVEDAAPYADVSRRVYHTPMNLKSAVDEQFDMLSYILTGDDESDQMIRTWWVGNGGDALKPYIVNEEFDFLKSGLIATLNHAMANFLFYRALESKCDLKVGTGMGGVQRDAANNRDYFARILMDGLAAYKRDIKNEEVICHVESSDNFSIYTNSIYSFTLYEESFANFVKKGGSIDAFLGYYVNYNAMRVTVGELERSMDASLRALKATRSIYTNYKLSNQTARYRMAMNAVYAELSEQPTDHEREFYNDYNTARMACIDAVDTLLKSQESITPDDVESLAMQIIAGIRFGFTSAYTLLSQMTASMAADETLNPMTASLLSVVRYLTQYHVSQVDKT